VEKKRGETLCGKLTFGIAKIFSLSCYSKAKLSNFYDNSQWRQKYSSRRFEQEKAKLKIVIFFK
jgi:hypothetical protein